MQSKSNNTRTYKFFSGATVSVKNKEVLDDRGAFLGYQQDLTVKYPLGFGSEPFEFKSPEHVAEVVRKIKFEDDQLPLDVAIESKNVPYEESEDATEDHDRND